MKIACAERMACKRTCDASLYSMLKHRGVALGPLFPVVLKSFKTFLSHGRTVSPASVKAYPFGKTSYTVLKQPSAWYATQRPAMALRVFMLSTCSRCNTQPIYRSGSCANSGGIPPACKS